MIKKFLMQLFDIMGVSRSGTCAPNEDSLQGAIFSLYIFRKAPYALYENHLNRLNSCFAAARKTNSRVQNLRVARLLFLCLGIVWRRVRGSCGGCVYPKSHVPLASVTRYRGSRSDAPPAHMHDPRTCCTKVAYATTERRPIVCRQNQ